MNSGVSILMLGKFVMIFSRGKIRKMPKFNFNEVTVDVVWDYKYLGVNLTIITSLKGHNSYLQTGLCFHC